jgi:hypothetical protein
VRSVSSTELGRVIPELYNDFHRAKHLIRRDDNVDELVYDAQDNPQADGEHYNDSYGDMLK